MSSLIFLLLLYFILGSIVKKNKKSSTRKGKVNTAPVRAARTPQHMQPPAHQSNDDVEAVIHDVDAEPVFPNIHGIVEEESTEGESEEEHKRHLEEMKRQSELEQAEKRLSEEKTQKKNHALRQAVIMSEVLGKPKALRNVDYY